MRIDYRCAAGDAATSRKQAEELVALAPDVIVSTGSFSTGQLLQATHTVPIVFAIVPDPVGVRLTLIVWRSRAVTPPASCSSNMA